MIKNETFTPVVVTERNDLIDKIEKKTMLVYIEGNAYKELSKEINVQIKDKKQLGNTLKLLAIFPAWIGALVIPGIGWTIAGVTLASVLGLGGIAISSSATEILKQYLLAYDKIDDKERFVLVRNDYSYKYHSVSDGCILTDNNKCPKCDKSYDKKQMLCSHCNGHIIKITNEKAVKNK